MTIRGPVLTGLGENDFPPPDPLRERFVCSSPECEGGGQDKAMATGGDKFVVGSGRASFPSVIPAQAGIQYTPAVVLAPDAHGILDPGLRRDDGGGWE